MRIGKPELEALKRGVDLVALVREHGVELKRTGKSYTGRCPFHSPDKNPSFTVDPDKNLWKCFGACASNGKSGGDAIAFLMKKESISFREAYERLLRNGHGAAAGSVPSSKSPTSRREKGDREAVSEAGSSPIEPPLATLSDAERAHLLRAVADHYQATLAKARRAQGYLKRRGLLVPEVLRAMRIGYADGSLLQAVASKGILREQLVAAGILSATGYEMLSGMVVVPLLDPGSGAVVQLYGRSIIGRRHHYLKGELRGLLNTAVAMTSEEVVLVESVLDALSLLVLGIPNVVALYGTNGWTKDHDRLLEDGAAKRVTLLLDSDEAGKKAALALGERLARRGLGVRVALLADAKDPNEALTNGLTADGMREVLDAALPVAGSAVAAATDPEPEPRTAARFDVEDLEDGFLLTTGPRRYRVRVFGAGDDERLRVRVKLEDPYGTYVDTLDLYVARARRGFVVRAARSFGADEATLERELGNVVEAAEAWALMRRKKDEPATPAPPELTDEERAEALRLLRDPKLLPRAVEHMTRLGYVGEETNKALGLLIIVSRRLEDPLSALILSQSGAGKSGLTELLERLTPPGDVVLFSRLTPQALYYMERDFLRRKVVIIEEREGSEEADYSLRTLQSRKKLVLGVPIKDPRTGKTRTTVIEVEGPAVFLETSAALSVNHENSTRCFEIYLDESVEQTRRIHAQQRRAKTLEGQKDAAEGEALVRLHWNVQRSLRPVRVHIPYAHAIAFPETWLRTRRDHLRFLNLIEASAFLHQYQRPEPKGAEPGTAVEATVEDYRIAYELGREVLGSTLADLKRPVRELLDSMRALVAERAREKKLPPERVTVTRRELRERMGLPNHQVRRLLAEIVDLEHVEAVAGAKGRLYEYRLARCGGEDRGLRGLLRPEELEKRLRSRP